MVPNRNADSNLGVDSSAFALMEIVYSKLVVLNYPLGSKDEQTSRNGCPVLKTSPFVRMHFACDMSKLGNIAGLAKLKTRKSTDTERASYMQFQRMVDVAVWLFNQGGGEAAKLVAPEKFDVFRTSPLTSAKLLLRAAQAAGVPLKELSGLAPFQLLQGHGEEVCSFLNSICDQVLVATGKWQLKPLVYHDVSDASASTDSLSTGDKEDRTEQYQEFEDSSLHSEKISDERSDCDWLDVSDCTVSGGNCYHMIAPSVDASQWRDEAERMSETLVRRRAAYIVSESEWDSRMRTLRSFSDTWSCGGRRKWRQGEEGGTQSPPVCHSSVHSSGDATVLYGRMLTLSQDVGESLCRLRLGEHFISGSDCYRHLRDEFRALHKDLVDSMDRSASLSSKIHDLSRQGYEIDEKMKSLAESMRRKCYLDDGCGRVTVLREAIRRIIQESTALSIRIGLLEHLLLARRSRRARQMLNSGLRAKYSVSLRYGGTKSLDGSCDGDIPYGVD